MTEVRDQLRSARNAYRAMRYPGNLAGELLPPRSLAARTFAGRRWRIAGGASAAAAVVLLSLLLSRPSTTQPGSGQPPDRAIVDGRAFAPGRTLLLQFEAPALPLLPRELQLQLPSGVEQYPYLAMQYRELGIPDHIPERLQRQTVPTIPADLPTRGVEWLQRVWAGEKAA